MLCEVHDQLHVASALDPIGMIHASEVLDRDASGSRAIPMD